MMMMMMIMMGFFLSIPTAYLRVEKNSDKFFCKIRDGISLSENALMDFLISRLRNISSC